MNLHLKEFKSLNLSIQFVKVLRVSMMSHTEDNTALGNAGFLLFVVAKLALLESLSPRLAMISLYRLRVLQPSCRARCCKFSVSNVYLCREKIDKKHYESIFFNLKPLSTIIIILERIILVPSVMYKNSLLSTLRILIRAPVSLFVRLDFIQTGALICYLTYFCHENRTHLHKLGESKI